MKTTRPTWDEYFMKIAQVVSTRSTCIRRSVGCVLVREDRQIISTGYNGAPRGMEHCIATGCYRELHGIPSGEQHELCRAAHAEQNAIAQAARHGISTINSIIYCTLQPCSICMKIMINAGVIKIVYGDGYPDKMSFGMAEEAKIDMIKWNGV